MPADDACTADTRADPSEWVASFHDIHFTRDEPLRARGPARWSDDEWWLSPRELHSEKDADATGDNTADSPEPGEWWRTPHEQLAFARKSSALPAESDDLDTSDWIESFRDMDFTGNEREPAGESARLQGDDWLRSLDGELNAEFDAEPTSDTTAGSREAGEWWRTSDEQLAFARKSSALPAESDDLTRAAEPAGDAGAAGPAGAERVRRGAWVLAERVRPRAWALAGFAALAILVAGTAGVVVVSRSDGSRPAGIVSDRTTAPTTTTVPVTTTTAPAPETSVPASPAPSAPPTAPSTTTTSRRAPPAVPGPAVTASPLPDLTPPPLPPPPPPSPPPPPATTSPSPVTTSPPQSKK
jgi:hypothetical protein